MSYQTSFRVPRGPCPSPGERLCRAHGSDSPDVYKRYARESKDAEQIRSSSWVDISCWIEGSSTKIVSQSKREMEVKSLVVKTNLACESDEIYFLRSSGSSGSIYTHVQHQAMDGL